MYYRLSGFLFIYSESGELDGYVDNYGINQQIWVVRNVVGGYKGYR